MSVQRPTLGRSAPRTPFWTVAVALAALIGSCSSSSNQNGYDVELDVISTTPTNGDDPLRALSAQIALSDTNPSLPGSLSFNDTRPWAGLMLAEETLRRDGAPPGFVMSMDGFTFDADGTVDFFVRVYSRVGRITGRSGNYTPTSPASCSFTLDPATDDGQDYADAVNQCLSDWIVENGVPLEFDMDINTAGANGNLPTASAKSGFARKATSSFYLFSGNWNMRSENPCDWGFDDEILDAILEGDDFFGLLQCDVFALVGKGEVNQNIDVIGGGAQIWDACDENLSFARLGPTPLVPGEYFVRASGAEDGNDMTTQNVPVTFKNDDPEAFTEALLTAASGNCADGTQRSGNGYAFVGWAHCGEVPRTGEITVVAAGFCPLSD